MRILIIAKHSKYEWERKLFNLSHSEIINKYNKERANLNAILDAHKKHLYIRELFKSTMNDAHMVMMDTLDGFIEGYDLVIVLGGDNSFTNVSHYVKNIPILGINSDVERSNGCLTSYSAVDDKSVDTLCEILEESNFNIEKWARLEATIDGKIITPATSEYFFGERHRSKMSRHILVYEGAEYEQKCSGIVVATGAGSTGWYNSANKETETWGKTEQKGSFVITEPYNGDSKTNYMGVFPGTHSDEITLYSLNDDEGLVSVDSWNEYPFTRGSEAKVYMGSPLNVLIPKIK